jgi:chemotaxis protein CheD
MEGSQEVKMGDFMVAQAPGILSTGGIGSCIALCLYSAEYRIGGLAHVMLPGGDPAGVDCRFAATALQKMITEMTVEKLKIDRIIAKMVGGANMFPDVQGRSTKMGERNILSVKELVALYGIKVVSEEVGGTAGRAVTFDLSNGIVTVKMTI